MRNSKNGSFKELCGSCKHQGCCTSFASPLVFSRDLENLENIGKAGDEFLREITIRGQRVTTIRKKTNSNTCTFWDDDKHVCSIYENRPFDCRMYPFDIYMIDGKYTWIVYSCNPESKWQWSETHLKMLENDERFYEVMRNIEAFSDLSEIDVIMKGHNLPYTILREVNCEKSTKQKLEAQNCLS